MSAGARGGPAGVPAGLAWGVPAAFGGIVALLVWGGLLLADQRASWQELSELEAVRVEVDRLGAALRDLNRPGNEVLEGWDEPAQRAAFERHGRAYEAARAALGARVAGTELAELAAALGPEVDDLLARTTAVLDAAAARGRLLAAGGAPEEVRAQEQAAASAMSAMDRAFQRGLDRLDALGAALSARTGALLVAQRWATWQFFGLLLVAVLGSGLATELLRRRLREAAALARLTEVSRRIVQDGDLTQSIDVEGRDAVGELAAALRALVERLREIPTGLRDPARTLTEAVRTVSSAIEFQVESATRQAVALQETQVTAEEIRQTSRLAADKTEAVSGVLAQTDDLARAGEEAVEQTVAGLQDIRAFSEDLGARVRALGEKSRQIAGITETVKDLADQSNMLALNAAIEAARSGEHGRGFAVVAREIRSLADQSIEATRRVSEILAGIATATGEAVELADRGRVRMEAGIVQVRSSGESLRELSALTREVAAATRQIAAAVGQQNAGIHQIFGAVSDQTKTMEEAVARVRGVRDTVGALEQVAASVSGVVGRFRV